MSVPRTPRGWARIGGFLATLAFLVLGSPWNSRAQAVVVVRGVPVSSFGSIDAADFDGDGDNDLMVIGQNAAGDPVTGLYTFLGRLEEPIPRSPPRIVANYGSLSFTSRRMKAGKVTWADMDGDGDPDLLVTGLAVVETSTDATEDQPATDVFENQGGRTLIIRSDSNLPAIVEPRVDWADLDGDGLMDLALSGVREDGTTLLGVYRHDGDFSFSPILELEDRIRASDLVFADFDGDSDMDLLVTGEGPMGPESILVTNRLGTMTVDSTELPPWMFSRVGVADYNQDGNPDLVFSGGTISPDLVTGHSMLTSFGPSGPELPGTLLDGVFAGSVQWADSDGDGDLDLLLSGVENLEATDNQRVFVYTNDNGELVKKEAIRGVLFGTTLWYDYNNDGLLDILIAGVQEGRLIMSIFEQ